MEQSRRRLRRLAIGVLHDTYLPSVEELLDVYFRVNRWNPEGLRALLQGDVKTYAKRWVLKEIHELLEQKPPEVQIDPLVPTIKENKTTDKDAIRRAVDKAVLSAAQHDTSICPLVIYDYERYTPQSSSQDGKSKKVEPDKFNNNMRLALYAMSTTKETQYSDDMERFEYAVASLREHFVLLCKEKSTNWGQTTVYMKIQTEHALTYAGAVECLLHTKTLLDRWLMLAKILKPQKLPRYSNGIIENVWFHNQIKPPDEHSNPNLWVVSAREYMDKQVKALKKDIKELQQNKQKKWDLLWEGSFRDWIEKNLPPDSLVLSVWDKLMAHAKENERTPENWDDVEKVMRKEEIEYDGFWEAYHEANPIRRGLNGTVDILSMINRPGHENAPEKTWTRGVYSDIAEYYDIFFNEKQQQYSCSRSSELEAKILLDLMTDTYLEAETKNREQKISDLLQKEEAREQKEATLDATIGEEISKNKSNIQTLKASQKEGKRRITVHKNQLEYTNTGEGQKVKLRSTVERNEALFVKNNEKLRKLEKKLEKLQQKLKSGKNATLFTDPDFVPALRRFGITTRSPQNTIKMQLERKQRELKNKVSGEIRNLVEEWRKYVTAMKDKQGGLDRANKEIQTLNTKLEHPELALGYWQRPAWGG